MIRSTWGDQVVANFGLGIVAFIAFLVAVGIGVLLFFILSPLGSAGAILAIIIGAALVIAVALLFSTLEGIYKAALYNYAVSGDVPSSFIFEDAPIRDAFRQR